MNELNLEQIDVILEQYGNNQGNLITVLQKTQDIYGYLPLEAMEKIANIMKISPAKILGVATFYTQFRLSPVGKNMIMICQGTACHVNGSKKIYQAVAEYLNINDGETTEDKLFTIKNVACLGCCSLAPAMMINEQVYGNLTPKSVVEIVRDLQKEGAN